MGRQKQELFAQRKSNNILVCTCLPLILLKHMASD